MSDERRAIAAALLVAVLAVLLAAVDPAFFVKDDFQLEFLPASYEITQAWRSGEVPLLSRHSWLCAGLAAEYQFGVFSVFRMLLESIAWLLPLSLLARGALLFIVHAAIAAAGGFLLARSYGVRPAHALMVALVAGLNGWILWWGTTWYAIAAAFAWLPWYWLALRGSIHRRSRWSWMGAAAALYLLVTAGAPYVVAMAAALAAMNVLTALARRDWRASVNMAGGSLLGLALSAPAVLMLLEYFPATARSSAATAFEDLWAVPARALLGFIIPAFETEWTVFGGSMPHPAVELLGAFVPLAALVLSLRRVRAWAPEILLATLLLGLMLLPSAGPFRWSFRWLPLFHLVLAVVGACALEQARRVWLAGLLMLGVTAAVALDATTLLHAAVVATLCVAWALLPRLAPVMPAVITAVMIVMTFLSFSGRNEVPSWQLDDALFSATPLDPARRYLATYDLDAIMTTDGHGRYSRGINPELRPGNLPMLARLRFVNGYSPMAPVALKNLFLFDAHGPMPPDRAESILRFESGPNQLLHHFGIDGLVVPVVLARANAPTLAQNGWKPAAQLGDSIVLHRNERLSAPIFEGAVAVKAPNAELGYAAIFGRRTAPLPVVLLEPGVAPSRERYGRRAISEVQERRNRISFVVSGEGPPALVVFRRPWIPGWRATIGGRDLPVLPADMALIAVEIPAAAQGEVELVYRPRSLVAGLLIAGAALLVMVTLSLRLVRTK